MTDGNGRPVEGRSGSRPSAGGGCARFLGLVVTVLLVVVLVGVFMVNDGREDPVERVPVPDNVPPAAAARVHDVPAVSAQTSIPEEYLAGYAAGAATAAALTSFISAVVLPRSDIAGLARDWQIGGVGGGTMDSVQLMLPFLLAGFLISFLSASGLNALALGDELAAGLGQRVLIARLVASAGAVVLCGAATAITGPIGFVGLVIPHACRLLAGVDHRWLIPFSAVTGAALLTASDIVGRIIARPAELDVGILTALIGAPVFIAIVRRQKVRAL